MIASEAITKKLLKILEMAQDPVSKTYPSPVDFVIKM